MQQKGLLNEKPTIQKSDLILIIVFLVLLIPALFINSDILPLRTDEPTRAVVALEMMQSGNYVVPTITGEFYYNKPPLYNWIISVFYRIGGTTEFMLRLPMLLSLIGFGLTAYWFTKKELGNKIAFLVGAGIVISGRILFYDSLLGLIDICFSWITYTSFMLAVKHLKKGNLWKLFLFTYLLTSAGVLMKGMPSLVFQGGTLLALFISEKRFWKLFSIQHIVAFLMFGAIVGGYFYAYNSHNDIGVYFKRLWTESSQRTPLENGGLKVLLHVFTFPGEFIYHFAPWTLLILCAFRKGFYSLVKSKPLIRYSLILFLVNIFVYWISPATHPRYLFMLLPFIFSIGLTFYYSFIDDWRRKALDTLFIVMAGGFVVFSLATFYVDNENITSSHKIISVVVCAFLCVCTWLLIKKRPQRLIVIGIFLLVVRIQFNLIIIPIREKTGAETQSKMYAAEIAKRTKGQKLYTYKYTPIDHDMIFYIEDGRGEILKRTWEERPRSGVLYIVGTPDFRPDSMQVLYNFETRWKNTKLHLVKLTY